MRVVRIGWRFRPGEPRKKIGHCNSHCSLTTDSIPQFARFALVSTEGELRSASVRRRDFVQRAAFCLLTLVAQNKDRAHAGMLDPARMQRLPPLTLQATNSGRLFLPPTLLFAARPDGKVGSEIISQDPLLLIIALPWLSLNDFKGHKQNQTRAKAAEFP